MEFQKKMRTEKSPLGLGLILKIRDYSKALLEVLFTFRNPNYHNHEMKIKITNGFMCHCKQKMQLDRVNPQPNHGLPV